MRITVYDFDDTLFCTTHFQSTLQKVKQTMSISDLLVGKLPEELVFENLAKSVLDLLNFSMKTSDKVMIITNATKDWVEGIFDDHLPGCTELKNKVELFSCHALDTNMCKWKTKGFEMVLGKYFENGKHQLISIGDSYLDRLAALHIQEKYPNVVVKHVKLQDQPSVKDILQQHIAIKLYLPILVEKWAHCDELLVKISENHYFISPYQENIPSMFGAPVVLGKEQEVSC